MRIPVYVINMDSSTDRWEALQRNSAPFSIELRRVSAVDGRLLPASEWKNFDAAGFRRWHGRVPLGSEYGCYMSHIAALEQIIANGEEYAVVVEDDARFLPGFSRRVDGIVSLGDKIGVVKLFNNRVRGFVSKLTTREGDRLGRCLHGPLGSSCGYLVSARGARELLTSLQPMRLPYDIALGRYWTHDAPFHVVEKPLLKPAEGELETTVGTQDTYRKTKLPTLQRLGALQFRVGDYIQGMIGAVRG